MKDKFVKYYLRIALLTSELSHAERLKVGAVIVKEDRVISIGYNGTPSGWDNNCELTEEIGSYPRDTPVWEREFQMTTKPEVLHAEANTITKLAKSNESGHGSAMFCTHAPCLECSKLIYQSGIIEFHYIGDYRCQNGTRFLEKCEVAVTKHPAIDKNPFKIEEKELARM